MVSVPSRSNTNNLYFIKLCCKIERKITEKNETTEMWKRKDKSWLEDTALEKMLVRYGKNAFRLFMFPKAETYVFLVGNVSFGFGKHTFPVGETYNRQAYNFVDALELWILAF